MTSRPGGLLQRRIPAAFLLLMACSPKPSEDPADLPDPPEVMAGFTVPSSPARLFLDVPWPTDVDTKADGTRDMGSFPNPTNGTILEDYRRLLAKGKGWGINSAIYLGFSGAIDPATLPADPAATTQSGASVQLLCVDAASPDLGTRIPLRLRYSDAASTFLPAHVLTALPVLGFPLRPLTTYALVVTSKVKGALGGAVGPSADLAALLKADAPGDTRLSRAYAAFKPLRDHIPTGETIVHATVFTTQDPHSDFDAGRAKVVADAPYPVGNWSKPSDHNSHALYQVYEGTLDLPQFQVGAPPFDTADGVVGGFQLDAQGVPVVQRTESVKFALTVPRGAAPSGGWPLVVMAHGTGGDYRTGIGDSYGDEAAWASRSGCATVMISQPLHRTRQGYREGAEELLTFNFLNPRAAMDLWRQSALESVAMLHSLAAFTVPAGVAAGGEAVAFRADKELFFGHSQGGLTGALLTGIEKDLDLAILSGAGGGFGESILGKTEPVNMAQLLKVVLSLPESEALDPFHPLLSLVETLAEIVEPLNQSQRWFAAGRKAPQVLIFSGLQDVFTPPETHGPLAAAAGIPLLAPQFQAVPALDLRGMSVQSSPARSNLSLGAGRVTTAVLAQFPEDGHFAIYENRSATDLAAHFLASYLADGAAEATR